MQLWRALSCIFLFSLLLYQAPAAETITNSSLYLLTYDHGGVILWGTDHFAERLRNAVAWLERYPGLKIGLENEAYAYDYLAGKDPALLAELQEDLKKYHGRLGLGTCTYGQPLSSFINGESNIRQIAYAIKTDQKYFGYQPPIYLMSEHAMHSQMPQILKGLGFQGAILRTHFMMYGYNPTFDLPIGWWVGLDGSRIPAIPTYSGEGAAFGRTTVDNWFLTRYPGTEAKQSPEDFRRQFSHIAPLLATRADDAGLRKEELVKRYSANPDYRWVLLDDLSAIFPKPTVDMKTLPNDFKVRMPWGYCGNEIWNLNRRAEVRVLTAERLAALELWLGGDSHEAELERAWKDLLVGQHHDVQICGLLPEARRFLSNSIAGSKSVIDSTLHFMAARMGGEGFAQVTVFNPLSWARREWIQTDVVVSQEGVRKLAAKHEGHLAPCTLLHADCSSNGSIRNARIAFLAELPALAIGSYSIVPTDEPDLKPTLPGPNSGSGPSPAQPPQVEFDPAKLQVSTPDYEIHLDPHGGISCLLSKRTGQPLFTLGKRSAFFAGRINGTDCESHGQWTLHPASPEAPWVTAREDGFIADIPYTLEIRVQANTPRLDCRALFHFDDQKIGLLSKDTRDSHAPFVHEHKLRFKLFPQAGPEAIGVRDLPFAIAETTNRYVEGIYWAAVADARGGVALLNRGTMGTVREVDGGFSVPLAYAMYYVWGTRMLNGDFTYEFALLPFAGPWHQADLHRQALAYNFPLVSLASAPTNSTGPETLRPLLLDSASVIFSALYPDQGHVYARIFDYAGTGGNAELRGTGSEVRLWATDLLGARETSAANPIPLQPWQFRTFRLQPSPP